MVELQFATVMHQTELGASAEMLLNHHPPFDPNVTWRLYKSPINKYKSGRLAKQWRNYIQISFLESILGISWNNGGCSMENANRSQTFLNGNP